MEKDDTKSLAEWVKPEVVDIDGGPEDIESGGGNPTGDFTTASSS